MTMNERLLRGAAVALLLSVPLARADGSALILGRESSLRLEGDSTLHPYSSAATELIVEGELLPAKAGGSLLDRAREDGLKGLAVRVPVRGLKSGKGGLDKNMRKALRAEEHPEIVFELEAYAMTPHPEEAGAFQAKASGRLTVAGEERPSELEAVIVPVEGGLRVRGSEELLMSDFGIKPPSMMLGTLKTEDRVVIHFDLTLGSGEETGAETRRER